LDVADPNHKAESELDTLTVQTVTSEKITIHLDLGSSTVWDAKITLQKSTGIDPEQQRLIYNGKMLENHLLLSDYSIKSDRIIHMVLRLLGGIR